MHIFLAVIIVLGLYIETVPVYIMIKTFVHDSQLQCMSALLKITLLVVYKQSHVLEHSNISPYLADQISCAFWNI